MRVLLTSSWLAWVFSDEMCNRDSTSDLSLIQREAAIKRRDVMVQVPTAKEGEDRAVQLLPPQPQECHSTITIQREVVKKPFTETFNGSRWGNVLGPYWAARALAELGGAAYQGGTFGHGSWMEFLPNDVPASTQTLNVSAFNRMSECFCHGGIYSHGCQYGWADIAATIRRDTRAALAVWASRNGEQLPVFNPTDWLLYDRCCFMYEVHYGQADFDIFKSLPQKGSYVVFTLTPPKIDETEGRGICTQLHRARDEFILKHNPDIRIVKLDSVSLFQDFARLVFAPNVITPSAGSSWFWFSTLANDGHIVMPPFHYDVSGYPSNMYVDQTVSVLYPGRVERAKHEILHCPVVFNSLEEAVLWATRRVPTENICQFRAQPEGGCIASHPFKMNGEASTCCDIKPWTGGMDYTKSCIDLHQKQMQDHVALKQVRHREDGAGDFTLTASPIFHTFLTLPVCVGVFVFSLWNNYAIKKERLFDGKHDVEHRGLVGGGGGVHQVSSTRIFLMILCYAFASAGTFTLNKAVILKIPYPHLVVSYQCFVTFWIFLLLQYDDIHFGSMRTTMKWFFAVTILCAGMLWSSMVALQFATVTAVYICRNLMPIFVYPIEFVCQFPGTPTPNVYIIGCLVGVLVGTVCFVLPTWNMGIDGFGVLFLCVNMAASIIERLFQRVLLHGHKEAQGRDDADNYMTTVSCSLLNNIGTAVILFVIGLVQTEVLDFGNALLGDTSSLILLSCSCFTAASLSFSGIDLQKEITATQFLLAQNAVKCVGVLLGSVLFADRIVALSGFGVLLNLGCSFGYGFVSQRAKSSKV